MPPRKPVQATTMTLFQGGVGSLVCSLISQKRGRYVAEKTQRMRTTITARLISKASPTPVFRDPSTRALRIWRSCSPIKRNNKPLRTKTRTFQTALACRRVVDEKKREERRLKYSPAESTASTPETCKAEAVR